MLQEVITLRTRLWVAYQEEVRQLSTSFLQRLLKADQEQGSQQELLRSTLHPYLMTFCLLKRSSMMVPPLVQAMLDKRIRITILMETTAVLEAP